MGWFKKSAQERRHELLERMKNVLRHIYSILQIAESKQLDQAITYFKNNYPKEAEAKFANLLRTLEQIRHIETMNEGEERNLALDKFADKQEIQINLLKHLEIAIKHIERGDLRYANEAHELLDRLEKAVRDESRDVAKAA